MQTPLGIFGGTFDPVHLGHLLPVTDAAREIGLHRVKLLPCHIPAHKATPTVSAAQRLAMVRLVCAKWPLFELDDRELRRDSPSYSVDTLNEYRREEGNRPLVFFIGLDSLKNLNSWHRWQEILTLCHLVVCRRGDCLASFNPDVSRLLEQHRTRDARHLKEKPAGLIYLADTRELAISSTELRESLARGEATDLLPEEVLAYIQLHGLYGVRSEE